MRTWSLESAVIRAQSLVAVGVQGVWDVFTHRPAYSNDHPIPGCPSPSDCRGFGCAGDCSEALDAPAYDDEVPDTNEPLAPCDSCERSGPPEQLRSGDDGESWCCPDCVAAAFAARDKWPNDEVPNPYEPSLSDDELVAVRGLIQERYDPTSSPAAGARAAGSSPSEVSGAIPPVPPSEGCPDLSLPWQIADLTEHYTTLAVPGERPWGITDSLGRVIARIETRAHAEVVVAAVNTDPSRSNRLASVRGEGGAPDSGIRKSPGAPQSDLDWAGWAEPAICEVLAEHELVRRERTVGRYACRNPFALETIHATFADEFEWREHVAPIIASRLACDPARAIAALHNHKPK